MAKMACAQCGKVMKKGGTKKMATGGVTLTQKGAGYAKAQKGGSNAKMNIFGMPQSNMGTSGQYGKMKLGGVQDSIPMQPTVTTKTRKPKVSKVTDKARVGMSVNVKHSPPVGMRHNDSRTGFESVSEKKKGGMTKMAMGRTNKKPLRKATNGTTVGSTTPAPIPKQSPMTPLTEAEKRKLQVRWEQVNNRPLPPNTDLTPSSENFRTGAGPYSVNITPNQKRGGTKMAKGGAKVAYKKPLRKAQDGKIVKEGPLTEKDTQMLNTNPMYKDTNSAYGYISSGMKPTPKGYRVTPQIKKDDKEKEIRSGANFKRGGMTKAKKMAVGGIAKAKVGRVVKPPMGVSWINDAVKKGNNTSTDTGNPMADGFNRGIASVKDFGKGVSEGFKSSVKGVGNMINTVANSSTRDKDKTPNTPKHKKGGMTKAKRFAALAPPYNKATAADRIAGAKKNKRK